VGSGDDAPGFALHNMAWLSYADFWLGNWDVVVNETAPSVRLLMGDRADDPPYFVGHHFGAAAFIHVARQDRDMTSSLELLTRVVDRAEAAAGPIGGLQFKAWEAWIRAREGDVTEAMARLDRISDQLSRPCFDIMRASVMLDSGLHSRAEDFIIGSRSFAASAGIKALPPHLDRLEGAGLLARGSHDAAIELLASAVDAFGQLEVPWEVARTNLWLAEAHSAMGDSDAASAAVGSAQPILEELGSLLEIKRARSLLARL